MINEHFEMIMALTFKTDLASSTSRCIRVMPIPTETGALWSVTGWTYLSWSLSKCSRSLCLTDKLFFFCSGTLEWVTLLPFEVNTPELVTFASSDLLGLSTFVWLLPVDPWHSTAEESIISGFECRTWLKFKIIPFKRHGQNFYWISNPFHYK